MSEFFEVYKMLVSHEMFHKDGAPNITAISTNPDTQGNPGSVEFDYKSVWDREDRYMDVAGFYHTHPSGLNQMSQIDVETMTQWVKCLGKSLLCIIETDEQINGWLFTKSDTGKVSYREVKVHTENDVVYNVWLNPQESFFNPVDFLTTGAMADEDEGPDIFEAMEERLSSIEKNQTEMIDRYNKLLDILKSLIRQHEIQRK